MFPGQNDQFGAPFDGGGSSAGGPPPADGIFGSAFDEVDEFLGVDNEVITPVDSHEFLTVGLHFFERIKGMK